MTFRLECILPLQDDLPSQAAIDSEHMLAVLAQSPDSMMRKELMQNMRSLKQPFTYIVSEQAKAFRKDVRRCSSRWTLAPALEPHEQARAVNGLAHCSYKASTSNVSNKVTNRKRLMHMTNGMICPTCCVPEI